MSKSKYNPGDRVVVMLKPNELGRTIASYDDGHMICNITSDPDGDGTHQLVVEDPDPSNPTPVGDLFIVELVSTETPDANAYWRIVDDGA